MDPETTEVTTVVVTPEPTDETTDTESIENVAQDIHEQNVDLDHEGRIAALETRQGALEESFRQFAAAATQGIENASMTAEAAIDVAANAADVAFEASVQAEEATEVAIETIEETEEVAEDIAEDVADEMMPETARTHPWFRTRNDWQAK